MSTPETVRAPFLELRRGSASADAPVTVLVVHHAGGSAIGYLPLARHFPPQWRLLGLDLPGRITDDDGPRFERAADVTGWLAPLVEAEITGPLAIFGHSMGALIAFELARELEARGRGPVWLGLSGGSAPRFVDPTRRRDLWSRDRLIRFMRDLGGTPHEVLEMSDVAELMVRTLRSDLAIVDTYEYRAGPPLRVPLTVLSGRDDPMAPAEQVAGWVEHTTAPVRQHTLPGGHFYLFEQAEAVVRQLSLDISDALEHSPT